MRRLFALLMVTGCAMPGERTENGCPADEICAPLPEGLYFAGAALGDEELSSQGWAAPHRTALGGQQTIRVLRGPFLDSPPFDIPYIANVDGGSLRVSTQSNADVGIIGTAPGWSYLRIAELGTDRLYDRIQLGVMTVVEASVRQPAYRIAAPRRTENRENFLIWAGRELPMVVALHAADGTRLVDDSLTVNGVAGSIWDAVTVVATPGVTTIDVRAGGQHFPATIDGTDFASAIDVTGTPLEAGGGFVRICFQALADGRHIYGIPYAFAPESGGDVSTAGEEEGCALVRGNSVTVYAGGLARGFDVIALHKPASKPQLPLEAGPAAGERALLN